ncbi:MAG TPA: urea ABC transporter ATP-binding protein UrtD [Solirubrobacteraceae bacterium]|jgi:urea transport system ATP-binding protein|nr:urea ABC transporter ATP-binding protein UrtD [Solirubrobacteraceae bacterium]
MTALLEIRDLVVAFDAFHAVDGLDLTLQEQEVRFVIGPNGAGKTTLIDSITNLVRPTSGSIMFAGEELVGCKEHAIVRTGIGRTFQKPSVFDELTVLENVDIAASFRLPFRSLLRRRRGMSAEVAEALEQVHLTAQAGDAAGSLSHGQKQWLEVAMVLVQKPRLLLLDEPVAGMTQKERLHTGELITQIAQEGTTVLVVEHDMDFVRRFAHKVTVMHEGKILTEGTVAEVQRNETVREVYLGRPRDARGAAEVLA